MFFKTDAPHGLPHHPFKGCVIPRPIGWVSTQSADGIGNLAPFSFFNAVSQDPPQVVLAFNGAPAGRDQKDTLANIVATQEFVVNVATKSTAEAMVMTSKPIEAHEDEADLVSLTLLDSELVSPKRIAEVPIHMECRLVQTVDLLEDDQNGPNTLVIGHVIGLHIDEDVMTDGLVDPHKVQPLARLGYQDYATLGDVFSIPAPWRIAKPE